MVVVQIRCQMFSNYNISGHTCFERFSCTSRGKSDHNASAALTMSFEMERYFSAANLATKVHLDLLASIKKAAKAMI